MGPDLLADDLAAAIGGARPCALDDLSRDLWRAHAAGMVDDDDAQRLAETIAARRAASRPGKPAPAAVPTAGRTWSYFPPKRRQPRPDRAASIARRRCLAASAPLPPALATRFTTGEQAALRIVAEEVKARRMCARPLAEIAARAGIGLSTARNAIRTAARLGLVTVEERRVHGARNLPNVVRIVGREWLDWIAKGGFKKTNPTDIPYLSNSRKTGWHRETDSTKRTGASGPGGLPSKGWRSIGLRPVDSA